MPDLIGPLTPDEWCSLVLGAPDDPFQCCGETSDLRDAAFHALRMGGDESHGLEFHAAWDRVTASHPDHTLAEHPIVAKLFRFYVEGRPSPPTADEVNEWVTDLRLKSAHEALERQDAELERLRPLLAAAESYIRAGYTYGLGSAGASLAAAVEAAGGRT
jgi:hypothetical protein